MKKYRISLLEMVPPDYYQEGIKRNIFQMLWHKWKWVTLRRMIQDLHGNILDIGCAGGMITAKMQEELPQAHLTGMDLYKKAIKYAKKTYPHILFVVGDAHKLPWPSDYFDAVVATETLEHLHNPKKAVQEIYRVLKPKGLFIVGQDTDNLLFRAIWSIWVHMKGKVWHGVHVSCMSPKEISSLLTECRFKIQKKVMSHAGLEVFFRTIKD